MEISTSLFEAILIATTCYFAVVVWRYARGYKKWKNTLLKIPHPKTVPFFGNSLSFVMVNREDVVAKGNGMILPFFEKYPLMAVWLGPIPNVVLLKAEAAKVVLSSSTDINKSILYSYVRKWIGDGLLLSTGAKWQQRRKMITPSFHFRILESFLLVMNEQADIFVELLQQQCKGNSISDEFDIYPFITRCTLDIICETAMGKKVNAQKNSDSEYVNAVYKIGMIVNKRLVYPWLAFEWLFQLSSYGRSQKRCLEIVHGFSNKIIREKRAELERKKASNKTEKNNYDSDVGSKRKVALLDMLLENSFNVTNDGAKLSNEDIREEVDTFMFEGHDTTSVGISWSLFLIGQHPEVQQKILDELHSVFGDEIRPITSEDLNRLKYLECCIKESMRLFPPVPFIGRTLSNDLNISGYAVPKGTQVVIFTYFVHRDKTYFPDPDRFDPDRFLPENAQGRDSFAYIPFSAGLRNCIGQRFALMEEKVVLSRIFQRFNVMSTVEPDILRSFIGELVLRPIRGIKVRLEPRKKIN
ncbi:Cytochrome P450 4GL4 [Chamberlinius hualienensis]